ncbi:MAG: polysaccharide biosynthesis tyrosine autokinase [Bacillota bacterium]|nr:polysaccharide biosynthesis tyrosine autokinase [Bacillota bacterium]
MENEMDLYQIWQVIIKRWKLLVVLPLLAALISAVISLFVITPLYQASTTLMVTRPVDTSQIYLQDIQVSRQLVGTYREIVHSRRVLDIVIANRSLPYGTEVLRSLVEVQSVRDTELINVMVTHPEPVMAKEIANEIARVFMLEITDIMQIENVSVVDEAVEPGRPVSPRVSMNILIAFVLGLMGTFFLIFVLEFLDKTVKDPVETQAMLGLPVIGMMPVIEGDELAAMVNPRSPAAEAFRTLRTNIQYSSIDKQVKKILISGANPACGKSTVSANLAAVLAQGSGRVLIIDADLRRPIQHKIFNVEVEPGLSSLIFNENISLSQALHKTDYDNLLVLPCGPIPPYPSEMLASERMKKLIAQFSEEFDYIIFDSPPIIAVTDAAILSNLTDGTLLVLDYGRVRKDEAVEAYEKLKRVQANVIGAIINAVPQGNSYYNGYAQYYYYGSSEKSGNRSSRHKKKSADKGCE